MRGIKGNLENVTQEKNTLLPASPELVIPSTILRGRVILPFIDVLLDVKRRG